MLRSSAALGFVAALGLAVSVSGDAQASVSIAVAFDALVQDADAVALVTPVEQMSAWEDGRIYTYTRVTVDTPVAGELGSGASAWVRTRGGVVGKIGQTVDGEPVFSMKKASMVFLHRGSPGSYFVSARAQGQYPVTTDEATKKPKFQRAAALGVLYPPKSAEDAPQATRGNSSQVKVQSARPQTVATQIFAIDVIHGRPVEDVVKDVAAAYKRLHAR
jgi:hypothetical protein